MIQNEVSHNPENENTTEKCIIERKLLSNFEGVNNYVFPTEKLVTTQIKDELEPLVIVACGSFSPITYLHLRIFEMTLDDISKKKHYQVIGGYFSPVSSKYKKEGLISSQHRVEMCRIACEESKWLMVDSWESDQFDYTKTVFVLNHFNYEINVKRKGVLSEFGKKKKVKIKLLAGDDLVESMVKPGLWDNEDLHFIFKNFGCIIVERSGKDIRSFLFCHDILYNYRKKFILIKQHIYNDISSTKVRLFIKRNLSIKYLLPNKVIDYINENCLYSNISDT